MAEEFRSEAGFRISPVDPRGRTIEPAVLDAAEEIGQRAVHYAEKLVGDPALATNLLEEAAAAVSRVLRSQQAHSHVQVRDLSALLVSRFHPAGQQVKAKTINRRRPNLNTFNELLRIR